MRAAKASRIEPLSVNVAQFMRLGWLQAGFSSFAYRLAHLHAPRAAVVGILSVVFLAF
jgi:hypothetical protein